MLKSEFKVLKSHKEIYTGSFVQIHQPTGLLLSPQGSVPQFVDLDSGEVAMKIDGDSSTVIGVASAADGKVAVAYQSTAVCVYRPSIQEDDSIAWEVITQFNCKKVRYITWDPSSTMVALACADSTVKVYDSEGGYCTHNFRGHSGFVHYCMFLPVLNKYQLFSTGQDNTIIVWDLVKSKKITTLNEHLSTITDMAMYDEWTVISVSRDKVMCVWDLRTNQCLKTIAVYDELESIIVIDSDMINFSDSIGELPEKIVVVGGSSGLLSFWNIETGKKIYNQPESSLSYSIDFLLNDKDGNILVITDDHNLFTYFPTVPLTHKKTLVGFNDDIFDICYLNCEGEGSHVVSVSNSEQARVFNVEDHNCKFLTGHSNIVLATSINSNHEKVATSSKDGTIKIYSTEDIIDKEKYYIEPRSSCQGHADSVTAIAWMKNVDVLASGSSDLTLKLWDVSDEDNPVSLYTVKAHEKDINSVAVAPNNKIIATASSDKTVKLWEVVQDENGASHILPMATLKGHKRAVWCVRFSPVDKAIVTCSTDRTIKIWSLNDFTCIRTFQGHTGSVLRVEFISAGMQIISAGGDGLVKLWTIKSNECVGTFHKHREKIWGLDIQDDEKSFVTGGSDSRINYWIDISDSIREEEREKYERELLARQQLMNLMYTKNYVKAIELAFELDQPQKIYEIFELILEVPETAEETLLSILNNFSTGNIEKCLMYIRDWNTYAKRSLVSQVILNLILKIYNPTSLTQLPHMKSILRGLIPYTERHSKRIDRLIRQSFILDYTLNEMNLLTEAMDSMEIDIEPETGNQSSKKHKRGDEQVLENADKTTKRPRIE
eukprot:TRINITY_DN12303_c0_g1_i1.p1 TRINITY_DN12303_c0_g1~~TRINITY_DN12303_c0_g1_i1.p1  ORF type:complete len:831 (-),score=173.73 TRINITY_DN12303_c0_g1_i1:122-2614(-)